MPAALHRLKPELQPLRQGANPERVPQNANPNVALIEPWFDRALCTTLSGLTSPILHTPRVGRLCRPTLGCAAQRFQRIACRQAKFCAGSPTSTPAGVAEISRGSSAATSPVSRHCEPDPGGVAAVIQANRFVKHCIKPSFTIHILRSPVDLSNHRTSRGFFRCVLPAWHWPIPQIH